MILKRMSVRNMKSLLCCVAMVTGLQLGAVNLDDYDYEVYAQVIGDKSVFNGQPHYFVKISKDDYKNINQGRKLTNKPVYPKEDVDSIPWHNREYFIDKLVMLKNELDQNLGYSSSLEQLYLAYRLGLKDFKKLEFNPDKVKDKDVLRDLKLFNALVEAKHDLSGKSPPPLPTDGRKPVPYRFHPHDYAIQSSNGLVK